MEQEINPTEESKTADAEEKAEAKPNEPKKKLRWWGKLLVGMGAAALVVCIIAVALGLNLLNRLSRPGVSDTSALFTPGIDDSDGDEWVDDELPPDSTPSPTRTPATPRPHDLRKTPQPALPVSEYYEQTYLTNKQLAQMDENNRSEDYINILLVGNDRRSKKEKARADSMLIATLDKKHGTLKLTTLMRDILVDIPGKGYNKLNAACAYGGMELLLETINESFHLNVDKYVMVDFETFVEIIDKLGGITIELTAEEISAANDNIAGLNRQTGVSYLWDGFIFAEPGPIKLNGKQALGYSRIRKLDSDFIRSTRQFTVLNTVFSMLKRKPLTQMYNIIYSIAPLVETNLTNKEIVELAISALSLKKVDGIAYYRIPAQGLFENGHYERMFVFLTDLPANAWALHQFIFDSDAKGKEMPELTPNLSLPPRTPKPTAYYYYIDPTTGEIIYYYIDSVTGQIVYCNPNPTPTATPVPVYIPPEETPEPIDEPTP